MSARYDTTGISTAVHEIVPGKFMGDRMARLLCAIIQRGRWENRHQLVQRYPAGHRGDCSVGVGYEAIGRLIRNEWVTLNDDGSIEATDEGIEALSKY